MKHNGFSVLIIISFLINQDVVYIGDLSTIKSSQMCKVILFSVFTFKCFSSDKLVSKKTMFNYQQ